MRKFIVKNRRKRKYTRKHHSVHSVPIGKEFFMGFAPIVFIALLLAASLAATQIIRDQNITFSFTFHLPQISFSWLGPILVSAAQFGFSLLTFLDPRPIGTLLVHGFISYAQFTTRILLYSLSLNYVVQSYFVLTLLTSLTTLWHFLVSVSTQTYVALTHTIVFVGQSVWKFMLVVITRFVSFVDQMLYLLASPFRVLGAFYIQIKPYLDFFLAHVQMAGADLHRGFASFSTFGGLLSQH